MKKIIFAVLILICASPGFSQTYKMTLGEEIRLKKGTGDLDIIYADQSGLYFTEERSGVSLFSIGRRPELSHKLYKLDKNYAEVFDKDYKKDLKGLEFQSFQTLGDDLFLFATDYEKRSRTFRVFGAKIDKNTGDLIGDFAELGSYELESKKDDYEMRVSPVKNGNSFLMVSNISAKDRVSIGVLLLDRSLRKIENAVINLTFAPNFYELQDVQFTQNNKIVLLGKEFEETQVGKKKRKRYIFKQYIMGIYSKTGQKEKDVALDSEDRYIISGKLIEQPNGQMLLAGFFSRSAKKTDLSGFYINRVDPEKGVLLLSSFKEINPEMLGQSYEDAGDDDDETRDAKKAAKKAKDEGEEDEFPNNFVIRSVDINPVDNSIVITSEVFKYYFSSYTTSNYNSSTRSSTFTTTYTHRFINQDILLIHADQDGNIKWLNALPKSQSEIIQSSSGASGGFSMYYDKGSYFAGAGALPYYSSFKSMIQNKSLYLIFNDHTSNNVNALYGDKVRSVYNFRKKSNVYGVSVDLESGKMTRKIIGSNNDETVLMPRHAFNVKNELIVPSWRMRTLGKTQLRFAKISVK